MLKLIKTPNPILKQKALEWDFSVDTLSEQIESEMIDIMLANNGIGLAGNQVGLLKRIFVIKLKDQEPFAMFNPEVLSTSEELDISNEGCLSFPDLFLEVKRPARIKAKYLDKHAKECIIELSGIDARCFLHELDHLNGICFTDKISPLKLSLALKRKQKKRKYYG
jgi:peptide deformylase